MNVFNEFLEKIKDLSSEDLSKSEIKESVDHRYGQVDKLDYSESRGDGKLTITVKFANLIDMSETNISHVILIGQGNIIDLSEAKINILDLRNFEAVHTDTSESKISSILQ